ncbi:MAG: phosphate ABC transporter permease PstA [Ketobacter sp.]|nr:phosphate ABC transporter permease PstA [Planctomycetota bacterium]MCP5015650.1 phosphate ABC transporter permease PstA [Ketobacter sp.]
MSIERSRITDAAVAIFLWVVSSAILLLVVSLLFNILWHGLPHVSWSFLVDTPQEAGRSGGIGPILVSSVLILTVCVAFAVPLGVGTAAFLTEYCKFSQRTNRGIQGSLDILSGVPSIVFGLFGNIFFCKILGLGFSILSGGLTLACMVLPVIVRTSEMSLRGVSPEIRQAIESLGLSKSGALFHILLPIAVPGITAGVILSVGRSLAEAAALIFTSGYVDRMPSSLSDSGRALAIHIYDLSMNVPGGDKNAYASAVVLIALLLAMSTLTRILVRITFQRTRIC